MKSEDVQTSRVYFVVSRNPLIRNWLMLISMLWGSKHCVILCEVIGEDSPRYSKKIVSVGLRKCPYY